MRENYDKINLISKVDKREFINMVNFKAICEKYRQEILARAKQISYYDYTNDKAYKKEMNNIVRQSDRDLFGDPSDYIDIYYDQAINKLKLKNAAKAEKIKQEQSEAYEEFVNLLMSNAVGKIKFQGYTAMPMRVVNDALDKQSELKQKLRDKTDGDAK